MARFHAATFAKAWLSVALASSNDKDLSTLNRTVAVEDYPTGVRLVATDRFMLLTAWVPNLDTPNDAEPRLEEAPDRTVVVFDGDSRGKSLLGYLLQLHNRADDFAREEDPLEVLMSYDQRLPDTGVDAEPVFAGMETRYVVLEAPDTEVVYLATIGAEYPSWRAILDGFTAVKTEQIHLAPERLDRLAKLRKWSDGPIAWTFAGSARAAFIDMVISDPHVTGVVMPVRWLTEHDAQTDEDDTETV